LQEIDAVYGIYKNCHFNVFRGVISQITYKNEETGAHA